MYVSKKIQAFVALILALKQRLGATRKWVLVVCRIELWEFFRGIISRFRGKVGEKQTLNVKFRLNPTPTDAEAILKESVFE